MYIDLTIYRYESCIEIQKASFDTSGAKIGYNQVSLQITQSILILAKFKEKSIMKYSSFNS